MPRNTPDVTVTYAPSAGEDARRAGLWALVGRPALEQLRLKHVAPADTEATQKNGGHGGDDTERSPQ